VKLRVNLDLDEQPPAVGATEREIGDADLAFITKQAPSFGELQSVLVAAAKVLR
jgi:hypothetical protein